MQYSEIISDRLDEKLKVYEHPSGLKAYLLPKKGFAKKYATFATNYGSINNRFIVPGTSNRLMCRTVWHIFLSTSYSSSKTAVLWTNFRHWAPMPTHTSFNVTAYLFSCT